MVTQILQQQVDNGGNTGWVLIDSSQTFTDPVSAASYLSTLSSLNHYMCQIFDGNNATILAVT